MFSFGGTIGSESYTVASPITPINGSCNGTHYNCDAGTSTNHLDLGTVWRWDCMGSGGGGSPTCFEVKPVAGNGVCNMSAPNSCTAGTLGANAVQPNGDYHWYCNGSNGGSTSPLCWYTPPAAPTCTEPNGPYDNAWCQARGYNYSTNTCLGYCASCPAGQTWNGSSCATSSSLNCADYSPRSLSFSASPNPVAAGAQTTFTWSTSGGSGGYGSPYNYNGCTLSGPNPRNQRQLGYSGAISSDPINSNSTFSMRCGDACTTTDWQSVTVIVGVPAPTLSFSASPSSITSGNSSTLSWSTSNASSCWAWGGGIDNWKAVNGSQSVWPGATTTYYIECWNSASVSSGQRSVTVSVAPSYVCTGLIPTNTSVYSGDRTGLTANTNYAYSASDTAPKCQYVCNGGYTWNGSICVANCVVNCNRGDQVCSGQTYTDANNCGTNNCTGTRSCDFNWKEVAP